MGAGIDVLGLPFERGAITGFGFVEFTLLEINVSQLGMMMHNSMSTGKVMGQAATLNNTKCVNPPGGPAYC